MPSPAGPTRPERVPAVLAGIALITLLAWAWVIHVARAPDMVMDMPMDMPMAGMPASPTATLLGLFAMWVAMMAGMMLPSATPTILLYTAMARQRRESGRPALSVSTFVGGYLAIWIGFSALAALIQTRAHTALLDLAGVTRGAAVVAGVLLLVTGAYQWTPFKTACLSHCRSPLGHFSAHWREGTRGAFRMGVEHGTLCLACCWLLMGLLFVGGVMNPLWVGGLALLVLLEKVVPRGDLLGRLAGVGLMLWGVGLIAGV
jgi:predicted metal-binding membrane protein